MSVYLSEFIRQHETGFFPVPLDSRYRVLCCLADRGYVQTFLLEHRETRETHVLKAYDKSVWNGSECEILSDLRHPGIPKMVGTWATETHLFVAREYVSGKTLAELCQGTPVGTDVATDVMLGLCGVAAYLHGQKSPVIHRDIKPSNIIVGEAGNVCLIDFEISRKYDPDREADTVTALTRAYAAPEQFGYAQTDPRSDIYALGVVLLFMLSGSTDVRRLPALVGDRTLRRIIARCTAFAPAKRYPSVKRLQRRLLHYKRGTKRRAILALCAACVVALAAFLGFWRGYEYAGSRPRELALFEEAPVAFAEPLIEAAVRLQLDRESGVPLFAEDLEKVTELYIIGNRAAKTMNEYWIMCENREPFGILPGTITSLGDIPGLSNLKHFFVTHQPFADLEALGKIQTLEKVDIRHNPNLTDLSPLAGQKHLNMLWIYDTQIADLSPIRGQPIESLAMGGTPVTSLEPLRDNDVLFELDIGYTRIDDLSPLLSMDALQKVTAYAYAREAFQALGDFSFEVLLSETSFR